MGMYTGIEIDVILKADLPADVVSALRIMCMQDDEDGIHGPPLPNHPFFTCERWNMVLSCQSAYLPECEENQRPTEERFKKLPDGRYRLSASASLKNYGGEIGRFLDWIGPYVDESQTEEVGWHRYEEVRNRCYFSFQGGRPQFRRETTHKEDSYW